MSNLHRINLISSDNFVLPANQSMSIIEIYYYRIEKNKQNGKRSYQNLRRQRREPNKTQ